MVTVNTHKTKIWNEILKYQYRNVVNMAHNLKVGDTWGYIFSVSLEKDNKTYQIEVGLDTHDFATCPRVYYENIPNDIKLNSLERTEIALAVYDYISNAPLFEDFSNEMIEYAVQMKRMMESAIESLENGTEFSLTDKYGNEIKYVAKDFYSDTLENPIRDAECFKLVDANFKNDRNSKVIYDEEFIDNNFSPAVEKICSILINQDELGKEYMNELEALQSFYEKNIKTNCTYGAFSFYSDFHKDVYGYRPHNTVIESWKEYSFGDKTYTASELANRINQDFARKNFFAIGGSPSEWTDLLENGNWTDYALVDKYNTLNNVAEDILEYATRTVYIDGGLYNIEDVIRCVESLYSYKGMNDLLTDFNIFDHDIKTNLEQKLFKIESISIDDATHDYGKDEFELSPDSDLSRMCLINRTVHKDRWEQIKEIDDNASFRLTSNPEFSEVTLHITSDKLDFMKAVNICTDYPLHLTPTEQKRWMECWENKKENLVSEYEIDTELEME